MEPLKGVQAACPEEPHPHPEGNEGYEQPQLRSLHFNPKAAVTLGLGTALGYSSPSAAGKGIETIYVASMGKQDGRMGEVAWKPCDTALASRGGGG